VPARKKMAPAEIAAMLKMERARLIRDRRLPAERRC
jgi:hypothetical protein